VRDNAQSPVRAMVLTTQRTGSTFLMECLDSHPEIHCTGEILNGQPDTFAPAARGPARYLIKFLRIARTGAWLPHYRLEQFYRRNYARVNCFKVMYNQLARPFALRYFLSHPEIRVIHLARSNLLKVHVSNLLMQRRRFLQARTPEPVVWVRVDPAKAITALRAAIARRERYEALFAPHACLNVAYESLFDGASLQALTANAICDFLGVPKYPMKSGIIKLNPESLRDMVENYDELAEAISRTEFAGMLAAGAPGRGPSGVVAVAN
jgi:LPS sulfotransferase NodH